MADLKCLSGISVALSGRRGGRAYRCSACADPIDKDEERFPVTIIQEWKREAEAAAIRGIKGAQADPPDATHQIPGLQNLIGCPFCHTVSESDVKVGLGCFADVFQGSTPAEYQVEFFLSAAATFVLLLTN